MPNKRSIAWIDNSSKERMTHIPSQAGCPNTFNAMLPLSNVDWQNYLDGPETYPGIGAPADTAYNSVGEMLAIDGGHSLGSTNRYFMPCPLKAMFNADDQTADAGSTDYSAITAAALVFLMDPQDATTWTGTDNGHLFLGASRIRESYFVNTTNPTWRMVCEWQDYWGERVITNYVGHSDMSEFINELQIYSNAIIVKAWQGPLTIHTPPAPTNAIYASVNDIAALKFEDAKGNRMELAIPGPKLSIFMADRKTVDGGNAAVQSLIAAALLEVIVPSSGALVTRFIGGTLRHLKEL